MYTCGAKVGFFGGNVKKLMDDVKELRPTLLIAVPRILYRLYDKVSICVSLCVLRRNCLALQVIMKLCQALKFCIVKPHNRFT